MQIQFHKPYITEEEINEVVDSLRSGWLTMGPKTVEFEEKLMEYIFKDSPIPLASRFAVSFNSCTAALHLALRSIDLKQGDEVIIPTNTFTATGEVVCYFNAKPVIVDVDKDTHNISIDSIRRAISPRTRAVIPVHFAGQPCDMDEIMEISRKHGIHTIEDAAHALPASYKGREIGTIGDMTCFSFYATKTLATGEGGLLTTSSRKWAEKIKILRLHGISKDAWKRYSREGTWYYEVVEAGYKYNMTDIQAALGLAQLRKIEWMLERRRYIAQRYTEAFIGVTQIMVPYVKLDRTSAWHLYVIKLDLDSLGIDRAAFIEELKNRGIGTSVHFIPLHRHPFYRDAFGYAPDKFPNAEWLYERIISLPLYPGMTDNEIDYVIDNVSELCKKHKR